MEVNSEDNVVSQMDEEGSSAAAVTRSWGFRRSTIARREFMEAVVSVESSPPVRSRPPRGRGRGRRGRGRVLAPTEDRSSSESEARETVPCEERVPSDRAEDSDELNLQEIRKRAVARKLHQLKHDDDAGAKGTEDLDAGLRLPVKEHMTEITSGGGKVCSYTDTEHPDEEQEEFAENSQEDTERMNPDAVCCTCQQGHSNR